MNYSGNVVKSCIHCHQIGDAIRDQYREHQQPIPEVVLFPYPHPKSIGSCSIRTSERRSRKWLRIRAAAAAGFQAGDVIERLDGQPLLSMADVQWVLQRTSPEGGRLAAQSSPRREQHFPRLELNLASGWRRAGDISWRVSSWGMRRMATGGMLLEVASSEARAKAGVPEGAMALNAKHVGQFGPHAAAKNAGFRQGDLIIEFDGRTNLVREADLFRYALTEKKVGDQVPVTVWREGKKESLTLPLQK